jgi:hypothetical protein
MNDLWSRSDLTAILKDFLCGMEFALASWHEALEQTRRPLSRARKLRGGGHCSTPALYVCHCGGNEMSLAIWLPATFLLGLAGLGLCYAFLLACEKI